MQALVTGITKYASAAEASVNILHESGSYYTLPKKKNPWLVITTPIKAEADNIPKDAPQKSNPMSTYNSPAVPRESKQT